MLQFIDLDEENAFIEKEFLTSRNSTVLTLATTLAIILMFHDKLERENPVQIFTCELCSFLIVLQLLLRVGLSCLSDQCFAASIPLCYICNSCSSDPVSNLRGANNWVGPNRR